MKSYFQKNESFSPVKCCNHHGAIVQQELVSRFVLHCTSHFSSLVKAVWKVNFIIAIKKDMWWYKISLIVCYGSACFCCLYEQKINARNNWAIRAVMAAHGRNYKLDSCWENIKISLARTCWFLSSHSFLRQRMLLFSGVT